MVVYNVEKSKVLMLLQAYWDVKFKVSSKSVELFFKPGGKSWIKKGPNRDCNIWNLSVVICVLDTP